MSKKKKKNKTLEDFAKNIKLISIEEKGEIIIIKAIRLDIEEFDPSRRYQKIKKEEGDTDSN